MFGINKKIPIADEKVIRQAFDRHTGDLGRRLQDKSFSNQDTGVFPSVDEAVKILGSRRCRIYLGIDPTGLDIHFGHTIPLLFLKQILKPELGGHRPVLVIGDFTARIGDPTGKESARKPLTEKEVKDNMKNYLEQVYKILPRGSFDVKYNSSWLSKMTFEDVVKLASHVTVQQMITRDMFQERIKNERPIGLHEFLYPLMQGYDSVFMEIDGEVGGNDQTFNMLVGRDLEKKLLNKDKLVFTTQLLVDTTTGKKMSKSEGGLISVSDTPGDMVGKIMSVPDGFIRGMFKLCTERDMDWIDEHDDDMKTKPYEYKKELAKELVKMYHGERWATKAMDEWEKVFSKGEMPSEMETVSGAGQVMTNVIAGIVQGSNTEAKKLLDQGAVRVNDIVVKDWGNELKEGDILQVGPKTFRKVK
ncbi:MAG: Tyrosine-tRNA ligase [Candidatus Yanofskybacteria bacterium GW2011_GWA1_41_6]|uniref:Tyrosine--tRNA ligase n=1 Tax=Candidatus Yanofskybacteria bacterium GW2011_GWA1_41_6 TaxID=1619020 RepID=A0A0G0ZKJ5_9BACT|nr:MAG: Tyrosine-tRNA ligase [Candidatus Yanofskybacteria bacterium GW2011_GWA1_41_6]